MPSVSVRHPLDVYFHCSPFANSLVDGQVVVFNLALNRILASGQRIQTSFTWNWPVPNGWLTTDTALVLADNGNGVSIDADQLQDQETIGLRLSRSGSSGPDTFAQSLEVAEYVFLQYTTREWTVIV
jgi:hypothetical protein